MAPRDKVRPTPPPRGPALTRPTVGVLLLALGGAADAGCAKKHGPPPPMPPPMVEPPMVEPPPDEPMPPPPMPAPMPPPDEAPMTEPIPPMPAPMPDPG